MGICTWVGACPWQCRLHLQQPVDLNNFLCPFLWSIPKQKPSKQQHNFASCALHATIATFFPLVVVELILEGRGPLMSRPHHYCMFWKEFLIRHRYGRWKTMLKLDEMKKHTLQIKKSKIKYTPKIKKTTKHTIQKICCKEDSIRKHVVQRLSCKEDESSTCTKNNYNERSKELKQQSVQLKHKKRKCKCFLQGIQQDVYPCINNLVSPGRDGEAKRPQASNLVLVAMPFPSLNCPNPWATLQRDQSWKVNTGYGSYKP